MVRVHADHVVAVNHRRGASVDPISDANGHIPHLPHLSPPNLCRNIKVKKMFCFFQRLNNGWVAAIATCAARSDWAAS